MTLNASVIAEDVRLDSVAHRSSEDLARHRWHWTLDETNPQRVTFAEYARSVNRNADTITMQANGYRDWLAAQATDPDPSKGMNEYIQRSKMNVEKQAAIDAIASATGKTFNTVRKGGADAVRDVLSTARERVERGSDVTMDEAIKRAAEDRARTERTNERLRQERAQRSGLRYVEIEGHVAAAMQRLRKALDAAEGVDFTDEERELMTDSLGKLRAILNLIDIRVVGETDINWDAEFAKMGG